MQTSSNNNNNDNYNNIFDVMDFCLVVCNGNGN